MKITKEKQGRNSGLLAVFCSALVLGVGMFFLPANLNAQSADPPSPQNYEGVLGAIQNEIIYLNNEYSQNQGEDIVEHNPDLIVFYQSLQDHFETTNDIYWSIAYSLAVMAYNLDPETDLYQNIFNRDVYNQSSGASNVPVENTNSSGSSGGSVMYADDDVLYFYNYVRNQFKSVIDSIDLVAGDVSEFNDFINYIRESR